MNNATAEIINGLDVDLLGEHSVKLATVTLTIREWLHIVSLLRRDNLAFQSHIVDYEDMRESARLSKMCYTIEQAIYDRAYRGGK